MIGAFMVSAWVRFVWEDQVGVEEKVFNRDTLFALYFSVSTYSYPFKVLIHER